MGRRPGGLCGEGQDLHLYTICSISKHAELSGRTPPQATSMACLQAFPKPVFASYLLIF